MTPRPIMDAGPGINFFATHKERLLFATLGPLAVPETVEQEMRRKSKQDRRFEAVQNVLNKVPTRLLEILPDDVTDELASVVQRIEGIPLALRQRTAKDLGELMVIAHAVVAAEKGQHVLVFIDDGGGRTLAAREARRLQRLQLINPGVGSLALVTTIKVLNEAAMKGHVSDKRAMRDLYGKFRDLDDGLPPVSESGLLDLPVWT
ncbi:hypothetical protein JT358_09815 [Micrococcales bacterium 31B]|nr:hypothetical protein [Micrococcales bacterium 31B]